MTDIKNTIKPILLKYGVKKAALFGSYASGSFDEKSDVDILFMPPKAMGISYLDLKHELEDELQKKIDLVSYNAINSNLKQSILASQQAII